MIERGKEGKEEKREMRMEKREEDGIKVGEKDPISLP
jgi:hypothetical protein